MPTAYPKCSPAELTGLLVLLKQHNGAEDVARLADDLDLEIDEILPSVEFAQVLGLVQVTAGRAVFTDTGRQVVEGSIRDRKGILRDQLKRTTLYKALLRALESAPEHRLSEEEANRLIAFTTAPADEYVQNIINWGRYAELFRYDADEHELTLLKSRAGRGTSVGSRPPGGSVASSSGRRSGEPSPAPAPDSASLASLA